MAVVVWIVEGTWPACVAAAGAQAPEEAEVVLPHVAPADVPGAAHGALAGLLGRGGPAPGRPGHEGPGPDPGERVARLADASADELLAEAAARLGRPCTLAKRTDRVEREVVAAAADAELLVVARDGDRAHLGPRSLGPESRFVVDHAPCPLLLVWPESAPSTATLPPPPPPPPGP